MKKFIFLAFIAVFYARAQFVDGIVAVVENEPITDYEIKTLMEKDSISPNIALNKLIREKLELSRIKTMNLEANDFEVKDQIKQIAKVNNLSVEELKKDMAKKGLSFEEFKKNISRNMAKERLYSIILSQPNENINAQNARRFFEKHKNEFASYRYFKVVKYESTDPKALQTMIQNPMFVQYGVKIENLTLDASTLPTELNYILLNTPNGKFTSILNDQKGGFLMFLVSEKSGAYIPEFKLVERQVAQAMIEQERNVIIENYFNKMRSNADIRLIKR